MTTPTTDHAAMMAAARRAHGIPDPPAETGNTYADGMAAILYCLQSWPRTVEFELSRAQLEAARHVAPIVTARHQDESAQTLATVSAVLDNIAARVRRLQRLDAERPAPAWLQRLAGLPPADERPNQGPMAPLRPTPTPRPPQAPARPIVPPAPYRNVTGPTSTTTPRQHEQLIQF